MEDVSIPLCSYLCSPLHTSKLSHVCFHFTVKKLKHEEDMWPVLEKNTRCRGDWITGSPCGPPMVQPHCWLQTTSLGTSFGLQMRFTLSTKEMIKKNLSFLSILKNDSFVTQIKFRFLAQFHIRRSASTRLISLKRAIGRGSVAVPISSLCCFGFGSFTCAASWGIWI